MAESRSIQNASLDQEFKKRAQQVLSTKPILSVKDLEVQFTLRGQKLNAIRRCSLDLYDGETLAIVGESGSGKSVFTKTFVGMLDKIPPRRSGAPSAARRLPWSRRTR